MAAEARVDYELFAVVRFCEFDEEDSLRCGRIGRALVVSLDLEHTDPAAKNGTHRRQVVDVRNSQVD
jgi:hypothetical protein